MARAFICSGHEKLSWQEYVDNPLKENEVRIHCEYGAEKHGTMMSFYKGHGNQRGAWDPAVQVFRRGQGVAWDYPIPLGNMAVGRVEEVGGHVTRCQSGQRVVCYTGFRPRATVDESLCWSLPESTSWKTAVCFDPASFALSAVRDGEVRVGDAVAVFGLGAIGLLCVQIARIAGAHRQCHQHRGYQESRRELCRRRSLLCQRVGAGRACRG